MSSVNGLLIGISMRPLPGNTDHWIPFLIPADQKYWVVNEILCGRSTAKDMGLKYSINSFTIRKWVQRVRQGGCLNTVKGNPRVIDAISYRVLEEFHEKAVVAKEDLKDILEMKLQEEYEASLGRKRPRLLHDMLEDEYTAWMPRRSVGRYHDHLVKRRVIYDI